MTGPHLQQAMDLVAGRMVNSLLYGLLLAMVVGLLLRASGRQNARTRFSVWFVTLLGVTFLPFVSADNSLHRAVAAHVMLPSSWAVVVSVVWSIGVLCLLTRLVHGLWRVHRLRAGGEELRLPDELAARLRAPRGTKIYVCDQVTVPAAIGFFRPAVLLPRSLASDLSAEELEVVLLHELAHVERWDDWSNLAQQFVKTIFFFHPAVLWIEQRLTLEREMACDDIVLERTGGAKAYASCLISFAEKLQRTRALALVQPLVHRMCQLSQRVAEILDADRPASNLLRRPLVGVSLGLVAIAVVGSSHLPRLIAFHDAAGDAQVAEATITDTGVAPIAKVMPVKYVLPATQPETAPRAVQPKPATLRKAVHIQRPTRRAEPHRVIAVRQATLEDQGPVPTLVIFETSTDSVSGVQTWRLCIWQFAADAHVPVTSTIELKI